MQLTPSAGQGRRCDAQMRRQLGESLRYLAQAVAEQLDPQTASRLAATAAGLEAGQRLHPGVFGHYAQWVHALMQNNREAAKSAVSALLETAAYADSYSACVSLGDPTLDSSREVITTLMAAGNDEQLAFAVPGAAAQATTQETLRQAWSLADRYLPELAAEMRALVAQTILVGNAPDAGLRFDGGSSYLLWGALLVNADEQRTPVAMLELLAHETAHLLLYAAAHTEPLVTNAETQRYPSPLRQDPRPMDGIYHATWVSARMAWAMHQLAQHHETSAQQAREARQALAQDLGHFEAGYGVVKKHGQLTATGEHVMASAASWVAALSC